MKYLKKIVYSLALILPAFSHAEVIEVVTFKLKPGISYQDFAPIDKAVEIEHVSKQPGFISRESAVGTDREWLVLVRWESEQDADASMNSFMQAKAASDFVNHIDETTMMMKRYSK
ncbi:antibiotic biosynthesis monooxygenase family protein [Ferrimonas futtsuensis]|uniref:antibiotic biosynthesis monooxygenase family protein n=1 Tax=Ferrimonas futtsuensis TaxID=364764 RepID=UPI0003FB75E0|nr:antibiotic biosynthesis monooxygenase [Ferrimonas futtsuensis]